MFTEQSFNVYIYIYIYIYIIIYFNTLVYNYYCYGLFIFTLATGNNNLVLLFMSFRLYRFITSQILHYIAAKTNERSVAVASIHMPT